MVYSEKNFPIYRVVVYTAGILMSAIVFGFEVLMPEKVFPQPTNLFIACCDYLRDQRELYRNYFCVHSGSLVHSYGIKNDMYDK